MSPRAPRTCVQCGGRITGRKCEQCYPAWHGSQRSGETGSSQWRAQRQAVLGRDHHTCRIQHPDRCTATATNVDHLRPRGTFRTREEADQPDNLIAVCEPCHKWKTGTYDTTHKPFALTDLPWWSGEDQVGNLLPRVVSHPGRSGDSHAGWSGTSDVSEGDRPVYDPRKGGRK